MEKYAYYEKKKRETRLKRLAIAHEKKPRYITTWQSHDYRYYIITWSGINKSTAMVNSDTGEIILFKNGDGFSHDKPLRSEVNTTDRRIRYLTEGI